MKLFDVLKEDALKAFAGNRNINVYVGPDSVDEELIKSIQRALAKHSLALGQREEGSWWPNNTKAWTGGETGKFDSALGNAMRKWQESVNIQIDDMPANTKVKKLTVNGVVNQEDGKILLAPLNNLGFLDNRELTLALANFQKVRRAFDEQKFRSGDVSKVTDYATFLQNIGREGWAAVLTPIVNQRYSGKDEGQTAILVRDWVDDSIDKIMNRSRNVDILFDNFRAILRPLGPTTKVNSKIGGQVNLIPDFERLRVLQQTYLGPNVAKEDLTKPKLLYLHFASIAQFEFERGSQTILDRQKKQDEEDAKSEQNDTANIDQISARQLAEQIEKAFKNNYWAVFTSARVKSDEMSIEEAMMELANAKDYDLVASEFNTLTDNILSKRMVDELSPELYKRIFIAHLVRIKRINPRLYHSAINFSGDSITVTAPNSTKEFEIMRVMSRDRPDINPEVFDVLLEDQLLKEAIAQSGSELPDLFRVPTAEENLASINAFIEVMNQTYPEMIRFYAHLPPFDEYAPLGPLRLKGIVEEGTVYTSAGTDPALFFEQSIAKDRIWLVGNGEDNDGDGEPDPGNANIYFDERYAQEGLDQRNFAVPKTDDEEINLTNEEMNIVRDLQSQKPDIIKAAIAAIFDSNLPKKLYTETIYRGFKQETGKFIEEELGGKGDNSWTFKFFNKNETDSNPFMADLLTRMAAAVGNKDPLNVIAFVAPKGVADEFKRALESTILGGTIGNVDEEHLRKLVRSLVSREDFDLVDRYYNGDLQKAIEDKDWWRSDEDSMQLLNKIGINPKEAEAAENEARIMPEVEKLADVFDTMNSRGVDAEARIELLKSVDALAVITMLEEHAEKYDLDQDSYGNDKIFSKAMKDLSTYLFIWPNEGGADRYAKNYEATMMAKYGDLPNYQEARERFMELWEKFQ